MWMLLLTGALWRSLKNHEFTLKRGASIGVMIEVKLLEQVVLCVGEKADSQSETFDTKHLAMKKILHRRESSGNLSSSMDGISKHTFTDAERISFAEYLNRIVKPNPPIDGHSETGLFDYVSEGIILNQFINKMWPGTIPKKHIAKRRDSASNLFEKNINNDLTIKAAKDLGCSVVNIGGEDISSKTTTLILGLLWQLIKKSLLKNADSQTEELMNQLELRLGTQFDRTNIGPEQAIMYWINWHVRKSKYNRSIKSFGIDLADSEVYAILLRRIAPELMSKGSNVDHGAHNTDQVVKIINHEDRMKRAEMVVEVASKFIGSSSSIFVTPDEIVKGNPRLNFAFCITLFNMHTSLDSSLPDEEQGPLTAAMVVVDTTQEKKAKKSLAQLIFNNKKEEVGVENIFIIYNNQTVNKKGSVLFDDAGSLMYIKFEGKEARIKREDIQTIQTDLWDCGILVSAKANVSIGNIDLQDSTIYFFDFDNQDKQSLFQAFLSRCKAFSKKVTKEK